MKEILIHGLLVSVFFGVFAFAAEAEEGKIRLLVRGDDMGFSHSANVASIKAYREGVMRTAEVLVPGPWFLEAVEMLKETPGLDVGVHLSLTSEWENLKWRPLTHSPSLVDQDGYFYPMVWPSDNYPEDQALTGAKWKLEEIESELRAQIELAKEKIPQVSHVTGHMGFVSISEDVGTLVGRLAREYGLELDTLKAGLKRAGRYQGPTGTPEEKVASFARLLEGLEPGNWLFVDHPGLDDAELRAVHHIGYENVAEDRHGVTFCWTHPKVKEIIKKREIELISYADLKNR
jgi:predicted glycoside hydrolase/deacetylase ChbG (UPF0249 family)